MKPPVIDFEPTGHVYRANGQVVPSVTQILAEAGMVPDSRFYTPGSAARGSAVHTTVRLYLEAKAARKPPAEIAAWAQGIHPVVAPYLAAFMRFEKDKRFIGEACELRVFNPLWRYAGTLDLLGRIGGRRGQPYLIDIKSGAPQDWHPIQTAAYRMALPRGGIRKRMGLYLAKDGSYRIRPHDLYQTDQYLFLAALSVARYRREHGLVEREVARGDGDEGGTQEV